MAATATDYIALTRKYTSNVNSDAVAAIVKYCGPALKSNDSKYVATSDKAETGRIVKGFCARKLGLKADVAAAAVAAAADKMKADRLKHRVPFYYLIAEHAGKLSMLAGKAAPAHPPAAVAKAAATPASKVVVPVAAAAPEAVAAPVTTAPLPASPARGAHQAPAQSEEDGRWYMKGSRYDRLTRWFFS